MTWFVLKASSNNTLTNQPTSHLGEPTLVSYPLSVGWITLLSPSEHCETKPMYSGLCWLVDGTTEVIYTVSGKKRDHGTFFCNINNLDRAVYQWRSRLSKCVHENGGHFEHLI